MIRALIRAPNFLHSASKAASRQMTSPSDSTVLFERRGALQLVTLNKPKALKRLVQVRMVGAVIIYCVRKLPVT